MHIQTNANKNAHIRFHSKTPHRVTKKNENLNMDNTITGSINIRSSLTTSIVWFITSAIFKQLVVKNTHYMYYTSVRTRYSISLKIQVKHSPQRVGWEPLKLTSKRIVVITDVRSLYKKSLKIPKGGNQNPYIEEEQTTQWSKEKVQKDKQRSTKHTYITKDRVTRTRPTCLF